ncbi:T6SS effector BTH_I2691 family protein [Pseudomonas farsensis]|uniref:T6SS effector BTH_I2691 family protein n=1 Tax=Pseudomonas farsensis TaxID=2745492 RepID=A0ABU8QVH2_9PSED
MSTLLDLCKRINADYKPALSNSPVAACTRRFELLPLRFAAVGGDAAQRAQLPALPGGFAPYPDVARLSHSSYAIRPLREGFFYLLLKRRGESAYQWHSQYRVAANGSLRAISAEDPWQSLPSATLDELIKSFGWTITLHDLDDIEELRPLYSPTPLTPRMLDTYRLVDDEYRNSLPSIDVQQLIRPDAPPQPAVLPYKQLNCVADFAAQHDPQLQALLEQQPFNHGQVLSLQATQQAFAPLPEQDKPRGAGILIDDAIGITQELNAWRNAAVEEVRSRWLQRSVEPGVDNERRLLVAQSFLEIEKLYPQMRAEQIIKRDVMAERTRLQPIMPLEYYAFSEQARRAQEAHDEQIKPNIIQFERETRAKTQARVESGEFSKHFDEKYGHLVDRAAMRLQLDAFEQVMQSAQENAEARARDHLVWVTSERLLQALDRYDETDPEDGLAFAEQTGQCVIGMELSELGMQVLDGWWGSDPSQRDNLAMRGVAFNQQALREELAQLREAAKAVPPSSTSFDLPEALARQAHAAANAFARINTLYEQLPEQNRNGSIGLYAWYVLLGRQVLRTAAPNSVDRALHHGLRLTLFASVHESAVNVRLAQAANLGEAINPNRSGAQVSRYLDQAWAEGLMQSSQNEFFKVRIAGVICLIEGMLMTFKARQLPDSDTRLKTELLAAAMTTAAAGFELGASYVDLVVSRYGAGSVTGGGAAVVLGRLKLWGAALASTGGLIFAWWDLADAYKKHVEEPRGKAEGALARTQMLSVAYFSRAIAITTLSIADLGAAIAIARPLFEHLARTQQHRTLQLLAQAMSQLSRRLGTHAARLLLARIILGAFWIGLILTVLIIIFEDDALEKWCKRSSYRLDIKNKVFSAHEELAELYAALSEII